MLFKSIDLVLYLTQEKVELWKSEAKTSECVFPREIVENIEIYDQKKFEELLETWIDSLKIKGGKKMLLILGDDMYFSKNISVAEKEKQQIVDKFYSQVIIDSQNLVKGCFESKKNLTLFAANNSIILSLAHILSQKGLEIDKALPISVFEGISIDSKMSSRTISIVLNNYPKMGSLNLLVDEEVILKSQDNKGGKAFVTFLFAIYLIEAVAASYYFIWQQQQSALQKPKIISASEKFTLSVPVNQLDKKDVSIMILNSSRVSGEASKLQKLLEAEEYVVKKIGNDEVQKGATTISAKENINSEFIDELINFLEKKSYSLNPKIITLPKEDSFDIVISI